MSINRSMHMSSCPECGAGLSAEPWSAGLCLSCLLELGLASPSPEVDGPADNHPTLSPDAPPYAAGQVLGSRYRVRTLLGRGGMGDVFRAIDLKLRVDVALKAVRPSLVSSDRALEGLRQEVRAAREVVSPNVCRVFDLIELDGRELVSMEYIDGVTLAEVLRERSPLALQEARAIASQLLAGLEAIHTAGLVHRDVKPENVMVTRAGRVVVMDFGIARAVTHTRVETISGTPAYMAIEQARGQAIDARADVFAAGVVLAEMVAPAGARTTHAREAIWRGVHDDPPRLDDTPWAAVLRKAVALQRDSRYPTAAALSRALDEVTLRSGGDETARPYPGLAAFTERDASFFVGRELEIEDLWKKLRRPHLLALIGPSGAGKSSLLRAGLMPSAPPGWSVIVTTPGTRPFAALAHALAPELAGDTGAVARLIDFEQPDVAVDVAGRWRRRHDQALLILDQFEELFTQSPVDVQERFAQLVARLALDADIHVLLSMRDDFLVNCHRFDSLAPIFSDLTAIGPPTGAAMRRALVQPALKCGYRFEDDTMVDEIVEEVAGERGALPLVAFAMARLWDARDRDAGLLTRAAYQAIGGVGGALAQHAEATLDRIGQTRLPIVREIFRNLITAQGTRATVDRDELLSVFANRVSRGSAAGGSSATGDQAAEVLDALIDARLLTAYEPPSLAPDEAGHPRIEIVHESLLTSWPRLVRWRTQDQDGAQLRDQLKQAARLWEDRGQPDDLLWTGTSFREYELWRERYAGTLSASEDRFARAMTSRALRRRRQRRLAVALVTAAALAVAAAMSVLWQRSEAARAQAVTAARQAEAQQLYTLGQMALTQDPTTALAYTLASLERDDSPHVRRLALQALWKGPPAFVVAPSRDTWASMTLKFSPDGEWLAGLDDRTGAVRAWTRDGTTAVEIPGTTGGGNFAWGDFGPDGQSFIVTRSDSIRIHALPSGQEIRRIAGRFRWGFVRGNRVITGDFVEPTPDGRPRRLLRAYPLPDGAPEIVLGVTTWPHQRGGSFDIDQQGRALVGISNDALYEVPVDEPERAHQLIVASDDPIRGFVLNREGTQVFTWHASGVIHRRSRATGTQLSSPRSVRGDPNVVNGAISDNGHWLATSLGTEAVDLWDLEDIPAVEPLVLRTGGRAIRMTFDPDGAWAAIQDNRALSVWPLTSPRMRVLRGPRAVLRSVTGDPQGRWIIAGGETMSAAPVWPLSGSHERTISMTHKDIGVPMHSLTVSPRGDVMAAGTMSGAWLVPLDGRPPERLPGFTALIRGLAFDADGRRLAGGGGLQGDLQGKGEAVIRVWNLDTHETQVLPSPDGAPFAWVAFLPDGALVSVGPGGLYQWDLENGSSRLLLPGATGRVQPSPDGRYLLIHKAMMRPGGAVGSAAVFDRHEKRSWDLTTHGDEVTAIAMHPSGTQVITGSRDGTIRVGPLNGDEPHLLIGHETTVWDVFVPPDGRTIVAAGDDGTVRLWPVPEGTPFHALPRDELLARLRALTNVRIVPDPASATGYRVSSEPFAGWHRPPPRW